MSLIIEHCVIPSCLYVVLNCPCAKRFGKFQFLHVQLLSGIVVFVFYSFFETCQYKQNYRTHSVLSIYSVISNGCKLLIKLSEMKGSNRIGC